MQISHYAGGELRRYPTPHGNIHPRAALPYVVENACGITKEGARFPRGDASDNKGDLACRRVWPLEIPVQQLYGALRLAIGPPTCNWP